MSSMERTNIFATKEEVKLLKKELINAQNTPVIAFSSKHALEKGGFAGEVWQELKEHCHKLALKHGLPEIQGFYGCDLENGEFVKN